MLFREELYLGFRLRFMFADNLNQQKMSCHSSRGRCYEHNFRRFSPIFGEKMAFFLKANVTYDPNFSKLRVF
jgi:hypothetical protein